MNNKLITASKDKDFDSVQALIALGANISYENKFGITVLRTAAKDKDLVGVKTLIALGANISYENKSGFTALMTAVNTSFDLEIIKILVENKAEILIQNKYAHTILEIADKHQDKTVFNFLNEENKKRLANKKKFIGNLEKDKVQINISNNVAFTSKGKIHINKSRKM